MSGRNSRPWRVAKIFVSSTFKDMQAERDHLVRVVFPRLRAELERDRIRVVDVDLRWGVTAEDNVTDVCSEVVDECLPHFIGMLGARYGWVPPGQDISITHREVRHVLRTPDGGRPHAFFYFRAPDALQPLSQSQRPHYEEPPSSRATEQLDTLRAEIRAAGHDPRAYSPRWSEREQRLTALEGFGELVYGDLLASIRATAGADPGSAGQPPDEVEASRLATDEFIELRTAHYTAGDRTHLLDDLTAFCLGTGDESMLCVVGPSGSGKSALLAELCRRRLQPTSSELDSNAPLLIPVFIGGGDPGSTDVRKIMRRLVSELEDAAASVPESFEALEQRLQMLMQEPGAHRSRRVVVILDAIEQLDRRHNAQSLAWLPPYLSPNIRMVLSATPGPALDALRGRQMLTREVRLGPIPALDGAALAHERLWAYRKKLEPAQLAALLAKADAVHPLYLVAALEELRTQGTFEEISRRITELPPQIDSLFDWLLHRLEHDPIFAQVVGVDLVRSFFSCLAVSRIGLAMSELADVISPGDPGGYLAILERLVRPYLMQRGALLTFFHSSFRRAVERRYLHGSDGAASIHRTLAGYFRTKADPEVTPAGIEPATTSRTWRGDARALQELVFHLSQLGDVKELCRLHTDLSFLEAFCEGVEAEPARDGEARYGGAAELSANLQQLVDRTREQAEESAFGVADELARAEALFASSARVLRYAPWSLAQEIVNRNALGEEAPTPDMLAAARHRPVRCLPLTPITRPPTFAGHAARVTALAVARSGGRFVSGARDGRVGVWDGDRTVPRWCSIGHRSWVTSAAISQSGRWALTGGDDGSVYLWDAAVGLRRALHTLWKRGGAIIWPPIDFCAFVGEDVAYALCTDWLRTIDLTRMCVTRAVRVRTTGRLRAPVEHTEIVHAANRLAVVQGAGDEVALVETGGGGVVRTVTLHAPVNQVALSDTGRLFAASDPQGRITWVDLDEPAVEHVVRAEPLTALCAMGETFVGTDIGARLKTLDVRGRLADPRLSLPSPGDRVTALAASSGAGILVAGRESGGLDVIDAATFAPILRIGGSASFMHASVFDGGRRVAAVPGFRSVAISESGNRVAIINVDGGTSVNSPVHRRPVTGVARLGQHGALTVDQGGDAALWSAADSRLIKSRENCSFTACAEWQAGGTSVAGTLDERVVVFGRTPRAARFHASALDFRAGISAIAAAGRPLRLFATYYSGLVRFHGPRARWTGRQDTRHSLRGTAVALDAGARLAASGNLNGEVQLWRCGDGQLLRDFSFHEAQVTALAFSPSGASLYSAGADGLLYVVDTRRLRIEDGTALSSPVIALQAAEGDALYAVLGNGTVARIAVPREPGNNPTGKG